MDKEKNCGWAPIKRLKYLDNLFGFCETEPARIKPMTDLKSSTSILSKKLEGIPEGLPPEEIERLQKLQVKLTDFLLHLIQAFLRTGYYTPEHPESTRAKEGLYQQFKNLFEGEDEVSFLVSEEQEQKEILVEGILPEPQRLSRMMIRGMGELYAPKFAQYLERKELISLTLKSRMGQTEFTQFVDLMSDPSVADIRRKQDKERFTQALLSRGILNISFMFNEELLAPDREIPWRSRVALSRMRKDLRMTPIFREMMRQDLDHIRRNLLRDALRPNRQSDLLCAILRNSDLSATSESGEEVIEDEIIAFLQKQYLLGTSKIFLREHLALKQLKRGDAFEKKSDRLVKKISYRLKEEGTKEAENLQEEFFRNQLIDLEDLTPALKNKILLERLTDKFLSYTDQFFLQLDQATEKEKFLNVAISFVKIIPELIQRDRYPEILRILETLKRHFHEKRMWALLAGHVLEEIGIGEIPLMLQEKFLSGKKETRIAIVPLFAALEVGAIPPLLTILKTSDDQWVRKNACEALIQIGPVAAAHLLRELTGQQTSAETTRDILRVLGEIKSPEWKAPLMEISRRYTSHENPKLKEQALYTLCQVGGVEGEEIFLQSLSDPDLDVQKRAVWCLGMIKSTRGVEKMMDILKKISLASSPQMNPMETQIYSAFGIAGNLTIAGRSLEQILLEILEKRGLKKWWDPFQKNLLTERTLGAILDALGKIGTQESADFLNRLEGSLKGPLTAKLKETLTKIGERTVRSKNQR